MENCLFCQILQKKIPAKIIEETSDLLVFEDINPIAKTHLLIVPKIHIDSLNTFQNTACNKLALSLLTMPSKLAQKLNVKENSYRVIANTNHLAGQTVFHLHLHFLANEKLPWP